MENPAERQSIYQELLTESFESLAKHFPKTHKATLQQCLEHLKEDRDLNANKYFGVYKIAIATKDSKLVAISLDTIDKLINTGFLDGNCEESSVVLGLEKPKESDKSPKEVRDPRRKLIDTIVEVVCSCKREKDDHIQLQLINVLTILATKLKNIVHGNNLQKILESLSHIYTAARTTQNQNSAKTSLKLIVTTVLQRVDKNDKNDQSQMVQLDLSKTKSRDKKNEFEVSFTEGPSKILSHRISPDNTANNISSVNEKGPEETLTKEPEETKKEDSEKTDEPKGETPKEETPKEESKTEEVDDTIKYRDDFYKDYISRYVTNIVDDVCLYNAKVDQVSKKYEGKELNEKERETMQQELDEIPFKAIPLNSDSDDVRYRILKKVKIENELDIIAGIFGWCIVCRNSANLFCKDTKVPVCSLECKFKHLEQADFLNNANKNDGFSHKSLDEIQDAYQMFSYLCKLSNKEVQAKDSPQEVIKVKSLALELLLAAMANPSPIFSIRKEFKDSIREYLCTSVLKNSVSTDKVIFSYSLGLFNTLVNHFREFLKPEMALFIDRIFLNMLESSNSSYQQRMSALQVFYKICSKANIILDLYVNYDCDVESNNLVERMVELLCKIAQGKYARPEYAPVVQPVQDQNLRFIALGALVNLVKALVVFTEDYNKQISALNKKSTPEETKEDEEKDKEAIQEIENKKKEVFNQLDEIGRSRWFKNELQKAIQKFNFKIKLGMKLFTQLGVIKPDDPKSVARFFKKTPNLSHEKLGEYFGDENEFNIKVLTEFSELIDLRNKTLDEGLRVYLKHFLLPGEGQKIDRVMQVFAGKYFKDNPKSFNSATAAYTLSFLFMMLQTDAHNPHIKPEDKMKLANFINLARGVNDGSNLSPEELTGFYNRIISNPLGLHEADRAKKVVADAQAISQRKKEEQFRLESDKMIKEGQKLIRGAKNTQYHTVRNTDCIKPLFHEVVWSPVLAVFSVLLEQSDDTNMVQSCLDGFANCIILTGLHNMKVERDTFVSSLAKFTNILTRREIKEKNIKCIKLLLDLASHRGNLLGTSWRYVLECIVWIDYYFHYTPPSKSGDPNAVRSGKGPNNEALEHIEHINSEIIQQIVDLNVVNMIFSKSSSFEVEEIIDFITCLCQISDEELKGKGTNTYCLQKLVEVAHFNMDGIKFIWSRIWNIMREHISNVALKSKPEVSLFAIDSLKQLSIKFLSQQELGLLEFQKDFLKPFETIFRETKNDDMKELILSCCNYIISYTRKDLKSGWKTIIDILGITADSEDTHLTKIAFNITESILQEDVKSLHDLVSDFTVLLLKFARNKKSDISEVSLKHLKSFLQQSITPDTDTAKEPETKEEHEQADHNTTVMEDQINYLNILIHGHPENTWVSLFTSIITLASDSGIKIQTHCTMLLFDLLDRYGVGFPHSLWGMVLSGVIKPLFDEIQYSFPAGGSSRNNEKVDAFKEFYEKSFERLIDVFGAYFDKLNQFCGELSNIILTCFQSQNQIINKVAANSLRYMIFKDSNLQKKGLEILNDIFSRLCLNTPLAQLLNVGNIEVNEENTLEEENEKEITYVDLKRDLNGLEYKDLKINCKECEIQCKTQLLIVGVIRDTFEKLLNELDDQEIKKLKRVLKTLWKLSKRFNEQTYLRYSFWKCGFMKEIDDKGEVPDLLELEKESLSVYSTLLFNKLDKTENKEANLEEFINMGIELIKIFQSRNEKLLTLSKTEGRKSVTEANQDEENENNEEGSDEDFKKLANKIKKVSLEKEILSLRDSLYNDFLSKLVKIDPEEIKARLKEITKCLIDGVVCFIPKESEEYSEALRTILNKYFEFCYERVEE